MQTDQFKRKSQLAVEFSYRVRDRWPDTWIFWVHAGNSARFEEGYRRIAERVKIPGQDRSGMDMMRLVYNWLCDEGNGRWVMIIDNADDLGAFSISSHRAKSDENQGSMNVAPEFLEFLPQSPNGSIVITSRRREVAFRLTGNWSDIIQIDAMDQAHALALLQAKLKENFEHVDAIELVQELDYMPLAITQAAAYISQRAPRATVSKYLQDLRKGDQGRTKLLGNDVGDSRRDSTASNSIISTWQISFEHIRSEKPSATRLLSLMSLFDRQGIPESLLDGYYQEDNDTDSDFDDDVSILMSFSLIGIDKEGSQFEMHRLVQFSTRKWLELHGELESWKETYVRLMDDNYPLGKFENWKTCQALFPHAQAALKSRPNDETALIAWASVLHRAAWYANQMGNYDAAEMMYFDAWKAKEIAFGPEDGSTLRTMSNLALTYSNQKQWKAAEELGMRVVEIQKRTIGTEHPDTLTSMSDLAVFNNKSQGRFKEAEELHVQVLEKRSQLFGMEHPMTLQSIHNLADTFFNKGDGQKPRS